MAKRSVGLYIGTSSVSVMELKGGRRPQLLRYGLARISPEVKGKKEERIAKAILKALDESEIKAKEVITTLPPEDVTVRYFRMARLPKREWDKGVRFEAKKYIPFKLEEITSDFQVAAPRGAKEMGVTFVAAEKSALTQHLSILQKVGLKAKVIEAAPFSLMSVFHLTKEIEKGKTTAIVNINVEGATISILKDKVLYLTRTVTLAKAPEEPGKLVFENLLSELNLSFDYYKKHFPGEKVEKMILCGEGSFEGWDELLGRELNLPVTVGDFRRGIQKADEVPTEVVPKLAVCCGLALRGLVRPPVKVDLFLRKEAVPVAAPLPKEQIRKIISIEVVACGLLLLAIYFGMFTQVAKVRRQLDEVRAARPTIKAKLMVDLLSVKELGKFRDGLTERLEVLQTLIDRRVYWTLKLNELAKVMPEGTWLKRISLEERAMERGRIVERSLTLEGGAYSTDKSKEMEMVNGLLPTLRDDEPFFKGFQTIELSSIKTGKLGEFEVTNFTIKCSVRK